jgi:hypothetical protein
MRHEQTDPKAMHVENLKARLARADYVVDPEAVAEAMLRRAGLGGAYGASPPAIRPRARSPRAGVRPQRRRS